MRIDVHDEARTEFIEGRDFYDASRAGYGLLFVEAVESEFELLALYPRVGKPVGRRARSLPLTGWPYSIIYQAKPDHIFIVAVAHHSRRPNYWLPRLR